MPPEPLSYDEVHQVLAACNGGKTGLRARALIVTLWRSGIRPSECLVLRAEDLDVDRGILSVVHAKDHCHRVVSIDPAARELLARWMNARKTLGINGHSPVFCTLEGGALSQSWVRGLMRRLARRAGVEKHVHAYGLRHTHATDLVRKGQSLAVIHARLGLRSLAATSRYLKRLCPFWTCI